MLEIFFIPCLHWSRTDSVTNSFQEDKEKGEENEKKRKEKTLDGNGRTHEGK